MRSKYFVCKSVDMANWLIHKGFNIKAIERDYNRQHKLVYKFLCCDELFKIVKNEWDSNINTIHRNHN